MSKHTEMPPAYWAIVPRNILASIMTPEEKVIFTAMALLLEDDGWWTEDVIQMKEATGMSEKDVEDALWRLKRRGGPIKYKDGRYIPFWKRNELEAEKKFKRLLS